MSVVKTTGKGFDLKSDCGYMSSSWGWYVLDFSGFVQLGVMKHPL
jgi:hypothetical protein